MQTTQFTIAHLPRLTRELDSAYEAEKLKLRKLKEELQNANMTFSNLKADDQLRSFDDYIETELQSKQEKLTSKNQTEVREVKAPKKKKKKLIFKQSAQVKTNFPIKEEKSEAEAESEQNGESSDEYSENTKLKQQKLDNYAILDEELIKFRFITSKLMLKRYHKHDVEFKTDDYLRIKKSIKFEINEEASIEELEEQLNRLQVQNKRYHFKSRVIKKPVTTNKTLQTSSSEEQNDSIELQGDQDQNKGEEHVPIVQFPYQVKKAENNINDQEDEDHLVGYAINTFSINY